MEKQGTDEKYLAELTALVERSRDSFLAFVLLMNPPGASSIVLGKLHKYLISLVQQELTGKGGGRLAVSCPPQHGKSTFLSLLAAAWHLGRFPGQSVAITGAIGSLLHDFSKKIRAIVADPKYALVFPKARVLFGSNRAEHWKLTNGSELIAKAAGSKLTGRRVDWLIIDDPHRGREEAESALQRGRVKEWYFGDCYTRLTPTAKVFLIGTRFHPEDLIGSLTSEDYAEEMRQLKQPQEIFNKIVIEALCEHPLRDPLGREYGEALAPELGRTREFLLAAKASLPPYEWTSQFQGAPQTKTSGQVDVSKLMPIKWNDIPKDTVFVRGWDLALTEKESSDFSAGAKCGFHKATGNFYICDISRNQTLWTKTKKHVVAMALNDLKDEMGSVMTIGVENVGGFEVAYRELKQSALLGRVSVRPVNSNKSKLVRAQGWFNLLEAGRVFMVQAPWNKDFIAELSTFPDGCFAAGTKILTSRGEVNIEAVLVGDECWTRQGWKKVLWAGQTGIKKVVTRFGLTATWDHPVWTVEGWKSFVNLREYDRLMVWPTKEKPQCLRERRITDTLTAQRIQPDTSKGQRGHEAMQEMSSYIGLCGNGILGQYPKGMKSITKMKTLQTTQLEILSASVRLSILNAIENRRYASSAEACLAPWLQTEEETKHIQPVFRAMKDRGIKLDIPHGLYTAEQRSVQSVENLLNIEMCGGRLASIAEMSAGTKQQCVVSDYAVPVFDLTVEDAHEFFANGVLVHNCHDDQIDAVTVAAEILQCAGKRKKLLFA